MECPICSAQLRFFLPFAADGKLRMNAFCPACSSLERDRAAWLHLTSSRSLRPGMRLLHVGPEACLEPRLRHVLGDGYVTADSESDDEDCRVSLEQLPFQEASFDAVICNHVLSHVTDARGPMRELLRVLVPGGWALLQVSRAHVQRHGPDHNRRLREAGFELEPLEVRDEYTPEEVRAFGLDASEAVYFCRRPRSTDVASESAV